MASDRVTLRRRILGLQAYVWRWLAAIGFYFHQRPNPSPPKPNFIRYCSTRRTENSPPASLRLAFYVPNDYTSEVRRGATYPVVLNFHGGGFTMGTVTDDVRWAAMVVDGVNAVVVSAEYRLAPEHPFPTAVDDGLAVILWLGSNASDLGIDPERLALTGFSAGGNMCFTVPLRLYEQLQSQSCVHASGKIIVPHVKAIVAWYPGIDYRISRAERRATCVRPRKTLPVVLTKLFDQSYLPDSACNTSPFVSPAAATDEMLDDALPSSILLYLCEWDMLQREGADFTERLIGLEKDARCVTIKERIHAFDKSPWPFKLDPKITQFYEDGCRFLKTVL